MGEKKKKSRKKCTLDLFIHSLNIYFQFAETIIKILIQKIKIKKVVRCKVGYIKTDMELRGGKYM